MARAYSDDLRERVAAAVLSGRSSREVAATFGVSIASVVKWSQRLRDTGSAGARPMGGHKRRVLAGEQEWMLRRLEECPHLTVRGLALEQKKPVRERAGSPEDRAAAGAVEEISGAD
jgi:transposase